MYSPRSSSQTPSSFYRSPLRNSPTAQARSFIRACFFVKNSLDMSDTAWV